MTEELKNIDEIFWEALQIKSAEDRDAYLRRACGEDERLRQTVQRLINAQPNAELFLEAPLSLDGALDLRLTEHPGDTIGPYKLLQQIGEGGMGVVYMAEQTEPVERRVALKIIKPGMDTRKVIARFEAERQALAMMDHPNIAKVLDAGTTETGRPYFVMELVKGVSVTEYCDKQKLTTHQRLELFIPICQAVQHAHQKGIIHRDLKPSNVLVAQYDDRPVPKVIDFGVAKAIEQRLTEKTVFTEFGQVVGTPEYMSPEQARLNQLDIDTRTDVYSLGVLLYELLTGETPFDRQRLRSAAFDELLRIIREEVPPRPSLKLSSSESLPSIAANRHVEPKQLSATVHGELDWIVMKALEKDRTRRYNTASKFAEDVQHYLNDEAVVACPPSAAYRFRKFARRNKAVIATTAAIAAALLIGTGVATWQAIQAGHERDRAILAEAAKQEEATRAKQEAERADRGEQTARMNLHTARINLAEQELIAGHKGRALEILDAALPESEQEDLRGFAWHHLWSRANEGLIQSVHGPLENPRIVEMSPDGTLVASVGPDDTVTLWDRESGREVRSLSGHSGLVRCVAFSSDSKLIATGGKDATVIIWNTATGLERSRFQQHPDAVVRVAFAPGNKLLASQTPDTTIRIWEVADAKLQKSLYEPVDERLRGRLRPNLRFSPDGTLLAAGNGVEDALNLWDVTTGQIRRQLTTWLGFSDVDFSPDGHQLVAACGERQVAIWDIQSGKQLLQSSKLDLFPRRVAFAPNGHSIAVGFADGSVMCHDIISASSHWFAHDTAIRSVEFSADSSRLVSAGAGSSIKTWNISPLSSSDQLATVPPRNKVWDMAFSHDGTALAFGAGRSVWLCDTGTGKITAELHTTANILGLAISPDGRLLATCGGADVELWDVQQQTLLATLQKVTDQMHMYGAAFSPDGRILAIAGRSGTITLYDVATQSEIGSMQAPEAVWSLAFSPNGKMLASGGSTGEHKVRLWDWQTQKQLDEMPGYGPVHFSPGGTSLAFQSVDFEGIGLWDTENKQLRTVGESQDNFFFSQSRFCFFPDGKKIAAVGSGRVKLWDIETGRELPMFHEFPHWAFAVAVSPDGQTLATGGGTGGVQLWRSSLNEDGLACLPSVRLDSRSDTLQLFQPLRRLAWCCDMGGRLIEGGKHNEAELYIRTATDLLESEVEHDRLSAVGSCLTLYDAIRLKEGAASEVEREFEQVVVDQRGLVLQQLSEDKPEVHENPIWHSERARRYDKLHAWDEAASAWAKAIELSEDSATWWSPRKLICCELADLPEAFDRVTQLLPDETTLWIGRGQHRALCSQWSAAVSDYGRVYQTQPFTEETIFEYAGALLLNGDTESYQQVCTTLMENDDDSHFRLSDFLMARIFAIVPAEGIDPQRPIVWATRWLKQSNEPWDLHVLGLAQYRAGEFEAAIESLEESNAVKWNERARVQNWLVLALAHHKLGNDEEARQWFQKAQFVIAAATPPHRDEPVRDVPVPDWIELKLLEREAEQLFGNGVEESPVDEADKAIAEEQSAKVEVPNTESDTNDQLPENKQ